MDVEEGAVTQDGHSNTQELVATPNSTEEVVARDAAVVAHIVAEDMLEDKEESGPIERLLPTTMRSRDEEEEDEEQEEEQHIERLPPEMTLEEWLYHFHGGLPGNTNTAAAAVPDAAAEEEDDDLESHGGDNMDDNDIVTTSAHQRRASPFAISEPLITERLGAPADDAPANLTWKARSTGVAPRATTLAQLRVQRNVHWRCTPGHHLGPVGPLRANSIWQARSTGAAPRAPTLAQLRARRNVHWRCARGHHLGPVGPLRANSARQAPSTGASPRAFSSARTTEQEGASNNGLAMPTSPSSDPANSTMQALFASTSYSRAVYPGMEEQEDNGWYDSIARDAQMMEEMEEEDPGLDGTMQSPLQLPISIMAPKEVLRNNHRSLTVAAAEEEEEEEDSLKPEVSLQDIINIRCLTPSELGPDEPGPSKRTRTIIQKPRVPPLADDEVPKFDCGICMETLPIFDLFHGMPCAHRFCGPCMVKYIEGRIRAGKVPVPCPEPACNDAEEGGGVLHPEDCKKSIDFAVFSSWSDQLTERAISPGHRVYCPNRACGVMLESTCAAGKAPAEVPCPACRRPMCGTCGLEWSTDGSGHHDCDQGPDAMLVRGLASERQWKQCPRCRMLVERTIGCNTMTCRCLTIFCYNCGRPKMQVLNGFGLCQCRNY
ncbi:unnamed protein product [Urochloa decumbens]